MYLSSDPRPGRLLPVAATIGLLLAAPHVSASVLYVDGGAPPGGDGSSWQTALNDLTAAIQAADASVDQIWVTGGTYTPTFQFSGGDARSVGFWLKNNLAILGGFAGGESDPDDRDPDANPTIMSGELGNPNDPTDNSWHILRAFSITNPTAVLDGFILTGGYANFGNERGGAANLESGSPTFINCRFVDNYALVDGGAVWGEGSPTFTGCTFTDNLCTATASGGGAIRCLGSITLTGCTFEGNISNRSGGAVLASTATVTDCIFDGNTASAGSGALGVGPSVVKGSAFLNNHVTNGHGGAVQTGGTTFVNCTFIGNSCLLRGGAIDSTGGGSLMTLIGCSFLGNTANEGGAVINWSSSLQVVNCTFSGNSAATTGGGISCSNAQASNIVNSTIVANTAGQNGGGIFSGSPTTTLTNDVLWSNSDSGGLDESAQVHAGGAVATNYCLIQGLTGGFGGAGNIDDDPVFVDAIGPDFTPGTADDDLRLLPGSPCIDAADNGAVPPDTLDLDGDADTLEPVPVDGYGGARFFDDPDTLDSGQGAPPIVDIGSYEFDGSTGDPGPDPGEFVGPPGGSWFEPGNWAGGQVPGQSTNVLITTTVVIDQPGAVADIVLIESGGTLEILAGSLTAAQVTVAPGGVLMLDDPAAQLTVGVLTVQAGGSVQWNAGGIHVTQTWTNFNPITIGCAGSAQLVVGPGASVSAPGVTVCAAGTLGGSGSVMADVASDGTVSPGSSTGTLTINGDYSQSASGTLLAELAGYAPGAFDQVVVNGTAQLDGTIQVVLLGGFAPQIAGDQRLVVATTSVGAFASEITPALPGLFVFELAYDVPTEDFNADTVQLLTSLSSSAARLYVRESAAAGGDGQSWATAANDFRSALGLTQLLAGQVTEVWVAAGTYRPDYGTGDRSGSFVMAINGVSEYGGFAGNESDLSQRNIETNPTILSGDLAGNDGPGFAGNGENSYHVVETQQTGACELLLDATCVDGLDQFECQALPGHNWLGYGSTCDSGGVEPMRLDGFTITGGNANRPNDTADRQGGGIRNEVHNLVLANCTVTSNTAELRGGGFMDSGMNTVVSACVFSGNASSGGLGGAYAPGSVGGSPQLSDCLFELNSAGFGGGAWVAGADPVFTRCTFLQNTAGRGGAMYQEETGADVSLIDCVIQGNVGTLNGGGIYIEDECSLTAVGCTFLDNNQGAIRNVSGSLSLTDCQFDGNLIDGAIASNGLGDTFIAVDTTFSGNSSVSTGGAINLIAGLAELVNCTFTGNAAAAEGGGLHVGQGATAILTGGTFSGNTASAGSGIYNFAFSELRGTVTMLGEDELFNGGALDPGSPGTPPAPGTISIDGTFRQGQTPSTLGVPELRIDLGGPIAGVDFDQIDASGGQAILEGGTLRAELFNGFQPELGQAFLVISAPAVSGVFDLALMPGLPQGFFLDVSYVSAGVSIAVDELDQVISFEDVQVSGLGGTPTDAALGDLDNDGDLDLVMVLTDDVELGEVAVLLNAGLNGQGAWLGFPGPALITQVGYAPLSVVVALLNGDDFADVAVANLGGGTVSVLFNDADGTGNLTLDQSYPMNPPAKGGTPLPQFVVAVGTTPGDTSLNLVVASEDTKKVRHFVNDGTGAFSYGQLISGFNGPTAVRLADVDLDGDDDLVIVRARPIPQPSFIEVWKYDQPLDTFDIVTSYDVPFGTVDLRIADLDGDLFPDLVTGATAPGTMSVLVNQADGQGSYSSAIAIQIGDTLNALAIADFDLDGDRDLVTAVVDAPQAASARIVRNDQNGNEQLTLATAIDVGTGGNADLLVAGDVNEDDVPDVVAVNAGGAIAGAATLGVLLNSTLVVPCPADLNGDGAVAVVDFLLVLAQWGTDPGGPPDFDGDGNVGIVDFLRVLADWGPCPE